MEAEIINPPFFLEKKFVEGKGREDTFLGSETVEQGTISSHGVTFPTCKQFSTSHFYRFLREPVVVVAAAPAAQQLAKAIIPRVKEGRP